MNNSGPAGPCGLVDCDSQQQTRICPECDLRHHHACTTRLVGEDVYGGWDVCPLCWCLKEGKEEAAAVFRTAFSKAAPPPLRASAGAPAPQPQPAPAPKPPTPAPKPAPSPGPADAPAPAAVPAAAPAPEAAATSKEVRTRDETLARLHLCRALFRRRMKAKERRLQSMVSRKQRGQPQILRCCRALLSRSGIVSASLP